VSGTSRNAAPSASQTLAGYYSTVTDGWATIFPRSREQNAYVFLEISLSTQTALALFVAQGDGRVHSHSCASGNENRNKGHETQKERNHNECEGIIDADLEQKTL
jgi:hypothetical protein